MNNETFLIEEADLDCAKNICQGMETTVRNRAAANVIAAKLASKYFEDIEVDIQSGLHNICKILEDLEISDIYIKNNYIDVRLYFSENELCVPKCHFENKLLPTAYMFIKVDENLTNGTVTGFAIPSEINCSNITGDYYSLNENDLISFYDVENHLVTNYEDGYPEELDELMFDYVDGKLTNKQEFFKALLSSKEARTRLYNIAKANDILSVVTIPDLNNETVATVAELDSQIEAEDNIEMLEDNSNELVLSDTLDSDNGFELNEEENIDTLEDVTSLSEEPASLEEFPESDSLEELHEDELLIEESSDIEETELSLDNEIDSFEPIELTDEGEDSASLNNIEELNEINNTELDINISEDFVNNDLDINTPVEDNSSFGDEEITIKMVDYNEEPEVQQMSMQNEFTYNPDTYKRDDEELTIKMVDDYNYKEESIQELPLPKEPVIKEADTIQINEESEIDLELEPGSKTDENIEVQPKKEETVQNTDELADIFVSEDDFETENIENNKKESEKINNQELSEEDLDNDFSTSTTPSMASIEEEGKKEEENANDNTSQEIDELFDTEDEENTLQNQYNKQANKNNKVLPILGVLVLIAVIGYYSYTKFFSGQMSDIELPEVEPQKTVAPTPSQKKVEEAMPIETIENVKKEVQTNEGNAVSIPAIEQNLGASVLVSNLTVNWEVPAGYVSNSTAKRYFNKMGKIIQLNLKTELLLLSKPPITNKIAVELEFNKSAQKFEIKDFVASSGEKLVDDVVRDTVNKALNINLNMNMNTLGNIPGNPVLIIKL